MKGYVLVSHGFYAKELKNSLQMIAGDVSHVYCVCLLPEEGQEQFKAKLVSLQESLGQYDEILIFADLMGGTPCNVATTYFLSDARVSIIAGMNFPQLLTALLSQEATAAELVQVGKDSIVDVKATLKSTQSDDEEED